MNRPVANLIERVASGEAPARVVERILQEHQPDIHPVSCTVDGDDLIFVDEDGAIIHPGANSSLDAIRAMVQKVREQAHALLQESDLLDQLEGWSGSVLELWVAVQSAFEQAMSTSYAWYPELDDFQAFTYPRAASIRVKESRRSWRDKRRGR